MPALAHQLTLLPTPEVPTHAAVFDIIDDSVVILASVPTLIPTTKRKRVAFVRHRKGYVPHTEAVTLARYIAHKATNEVMEL